MKILRAAKQGCMTADAHAVMHPHLVLVLTYGLFQQATLVLSHSIQELIWLNYATYVQRLILTAYFMC